jgi:hypothetical protein
MIEYLILRDTKPDRMSWVGYFNFNESHHNTWLGSSTVTPLNIIDAVFSIWDSEIVPGIRANAELFKEFDIPYIVYEGGQHMQPWNQGNHSYNQAVWDAQIHPQMYDLYMKNFQLHAELECVLFMHFAYVSTRESQYGSWGALENTSDYNSKNIRIIAPKYAAIMDANLGKPSAYFKIFSASENSSLR